MCGIFGILYHKSGTIPNKHLLEDTARILSHRGPDNYGIYADSGIGLVHTRLSLLDLNPRSNQPFWDKDGRYCLVYNGEVYNFEELRNDLEKKGILFRTTSDTEVLLEILIHGNTNSILQRLEGMFAFVLYDKFEKSLMVVRDRFGIKPLYIYDADDMFICSSEVKTIDNYVKLEPDFLSISSFLQGFSGPAKKHTFFKNIKILPPGAVVKIGIGQAAQYSSFFTTSDFWDQNQVEELKKLHPKKVIDRTEEFLLNSVRKHLIADAPVGALCSGGVDSSLVMAMASKFHSNLAVFHADVKGPCSEYEAALLLSRHLKLDLKSVEVCDQHFIEYMPDVIEHYEHPFVYHPNSIPFLMVSKLVQENGIKAVLSGEGSDECYLGYSYLENEHPLMFYRRVPGYIRTFMQKIPKIRAIIPECNCNTRNFIMNLHNRFEVLLEDIMTREKIEKSDLNKIANRDIRTLDLLNYHLCTLLHRNDCLGMAASIEARFPFLDHELVKLAVNMPYKLKIHFSLSAEKTYPFLQEKWIVRQVATRYLPLQLSQRQKLGFPTNAFERMQISPAYFLGSSIADLFELTTKDIQFILENADHNTIIRLLHLDVWNHVCLNRRPKRLILNRMREYVAIQR